MHQVDLKWPTESSRKRNKAAGGDTTSRPSLSAPGTPYGLHHPRPFPQAPSDWETIALSLAGKGDDHARLDLEPLVSLHAWLGRHSADLRTSHWERGSFVSRCTVCDLPMIKLPGLAWQLRAKAA